MTDEVGKISIPVNVDGAEAAARDLGTVSKAYDQHTRKLKETNSQAIAASQGIRAAAGHYRGTTAAANGVASALEGGGRSVSAWGATAAKTGGIAVAAFGLAARAGIKFDQQMSLVRASTGAQEGDFKKLRQAAIDWGSRSQFSATEVAAAMATLGKAGYDTTQTLAALPGALDAAAASGESMETVTSILVDTLTPFKMGAAEAAHVTDGLAYAANATTSGIGELGEAMKYVAPVARDANVAFDETNGALVVLAKNGIKGSMAGTSLRGVLQSMTAPNKRVQKSMDDVGLSFRDASGEMLPLATNIDRLKRTVDGMDPAKADQFLARMFGRENISAARAFLDVGGEGLRKFTAESKAADGAAKDFAATLRDNLGGDLEELSGKIESAAINITDDLTPALRGVVGAAGGAVDSFNNMDASTRSLISTTTAFGAAGLTVTGIVGVLGGAVASGIGWFIRGGAAIGGITSVVGRLTTHAMFAIPALQGMAVAIAGAPFLVGAAAIGAAGLAIWGLHKAMQGQNEEDERARQNSLDLAGKIKARRDAATRLEAAQTALERATAAASAAEDKYGPKSAQAAAALDKRTAAAKTAAAAQRDLDAAIEASKEEAGGGTGNADKPKEKTNFEGGQLRVGLVETENQLTEAMKRRRNAVADLRQAEAARAQQMPQLEASQAKLNKQLDDGDITYAQFKRSLDGVNGRMNDLNKGVRDAQREHKNAGKSVNDLRAEYAILANELGIKVPAGWAKMTSASRRTLETFGLVGMSANEAKKKIMGLSNAPVNLRIAKALLEQMTDAERKAQFGTSSINKILAMLGNRKPSRVWADGFSKDLAAARLEASGGITVTVHYKAGDLPKLTGSFAPTTLPANNRPTPNARMDADPSTPGFQSKLGGTTGRGAYNSSGLAGAATGRNRNARFMAKKAPPIDPAKWAKVIPGGMKVGDAFDAGGTSTFGGSMSAAGTLGGLLHSGLMAARPTVDHMKQESASMQKRAQHLLDRRLALIAKEIPGAIAGVKKAKANRVKAYKVLAAANKKLKKATGKARIAAARAEVKKAELAARKTDNFLSKANDKLQRLTGERDDGESELEGLASDIISTEMELEEATGTRDADGNLTAYGEGAVAGQQSGPLSPVGSVGVGAGSGATTSTGSDSTVQTVAPGQNYRVGVGFNDQGKVINLTGLVINAGSYQGGQDAANGFLDAMGKSRNGVTFSTNQSGVS